MHDKVVYEFRLKKTTRCYTCTYNARLPNSNDKNFLFNFRVFFCSRRIRIILCKRLIKNNESAAHGIGSANLSNGPDTRSPAAVIFTFLFFIFSCRRHRFSLTSLCVAVILVLPILSRKIAINVFRFVKTRRCAMTL